MSTLREDLIAAKALIDTPEKWNKGWYADGFGKYCALGAVQTVADGEWRDDTPAERCRRMLERALPTAYWRTRGVAAFNDSKRRKHADVMALFDRAIAAAPTTHTEGE